MRIVASVRSGWSPPRVAAAACAVASSLDTTFQTGHLLDQLFNVDAMAIAISSDNRSQYSGRVALAAVSRGTSSRTSSGSSMNSWRLRDDALVAATISSSAALFTGKGGSKVETRRRVAVSPGALEDVGLVPLRRRLQVVDPAADVRVRLGELVHVAGDDAEPVVEERVARLEELDLVERVLDGLARVPGEDHGAAVHHTDTSSSTLGLELLHEVADLGDLLGLLLEGLSDCLSFSWAVPLNLEEGVLDLTFPRADGLHELLHDLHDRLDLDQLAGDELPGPSREDVVGREDLRLSRLEVLLGSEDLLAEVEAYPAVLVEARVEVLVVRVVVLDGVVEGADVHDQLVEERVVLTLLLLERCQPRLHTQLASDLDHGVRSCRHARNHRRLRARHSLRLCRVGPIHPESGSR